MRYIIMIFSVLGIRRRQVWVEYDTGINTGMYPLADDSLVHDCKYKLGWIKPRYPVPAIPTYCEIGRGIWTQHDDGVDASFGWRLAFHI